MDVGYMKMALELARKAQGRTSPNPMVGAVVVKDGNIVGTGYHQKAGTPHAEVHALNEAGERAYGADLYVTLEPCNHLGRTPPCTEAIIRAGIKRVFVALRDPNPLVSGKGIARLKAHGIEVQEGLLEDEARKVNEVFLKYIRTKLPFVALKTATSLDGKIATERGESRWITGQEARLRGHWLRNIYDAILVGIGTVMADDPSLTCRLPDQEGRDPIRIIVDSKLSIDEGARVLNLHSPAPTIIATTAQATAEKISRIEKNAPVLVVNEGKEVHLPSLLKMLGDMEITSVLVEGGGRLNGSFLRENLVDKFYCFLAPKIIGGTKAPGSFGGEGISSLRDVTELIDVVVEHLGTDLLVTGYPKGKEG
ncbi:bifunctional diaminohydroxyphosphoribosylaminopyrimidine deaminase/5-amino-6-(5-phosphoribosylamino)uracil reductase RibD [Thermanaerosceptrum fracticalcis]|uniref:Riboflavin biosynthesis protein RibD n=1 Tax=Thermanaerosceptrum fracticalcis TaxID=1712410 RepID=A0A7G6E5I8_THEFR|nr:bifunctional diaminohydroxyphosphoribosylaminopyrimidine deaminase/5-amino-6-(5-phosphoribosylamino)uracil reductase RibD [Thermanaerosceptrum fracticalcis]QNB47342.1 bifunctional diaminohydroxyphosphoribosylaminopyrimidine deaminase/5-amino-6-(5-phosphoribosylamino)uracil reductase RibD [Thermanaerosceptrum fracticalcis]